MLLVITCWAHVEITVWMYPKCDWWIHWGKNDPEPTIYLRCSYWFPGHLAPSETKSHPDLRQVVRLLSHPTPFVTKVTGELLAQLRQRARLPPKLCDLKECD